MAMTNIYTGANGSLVLLAPGTGAEVAEAEAIRSLYLPENVSEVGRLTNVEVRVETELEEIHEVGRRHAASLHPGDIHISGRIGRAKINGALLYFLMGRGALENRPNEPYPQPLLSMKLNLRDPAFPDTTVGLDVGGVKFKNWGFSLPEDEFVMEDLTFKALTIAVVDKDAGSVVKPEFPSLE